MSHTIVRREPRSDGAQLTDALHPVLRRVLMNRGVVDESELDVSLSGLAHPGQLGGVDSAVALIARHMAGGGRILIVGDFDADGATSSCVCLLALKAMGAGWVDYLVPNRFRFGYGLTPELLVEARKSRPDLIITVDNGISSIDGVEAARMIGMDVIVTDHHLPGEQLPRANAIVNPNCRGDSFPSKNLAGVGVIFYLMSALRRYLGEQGWFEARGIKPPNMADYLDLVALGTVADVVGLDQNNRILVEQGLRRIRAGRMRPGIRALLEVAKRDPTVLKASDLAFSVAPRLNAAGRLDDMSEGIECLLSAEDADARRRAIHLDRLNAERREIEASMKADALALVDGLQLDDAQLPIALCLHEPDWHEGVVGIVASRVKEEVHRPVIAFARTDGGKLKGSARSVAGVHIRDVLERVSTLHPGLIERFGGHAMAAGLSLPEQHLAPFREAFEQTVAEFLSADQARGVIETDGALAARDINLEFARQLAYLLPWGQGFPAPVFDGEFELLSRKTLGDGSHLKMMLRPLDGGAAVEAIAFSYRDEIPQQGVRLRAVYELDVNHYRGEARLQCLIRHLELMP